MVKGDIMAKISNSIEDFLLAMLKEAEGSLEIQRSLLAERFDCAPSQINYVLTTRFTPYKGYYVESRRGGGGFIRITKVRFPNAELARNVFIDEIGDSITRDKAEELINSLLKAGKLTQREANIIKAAISDRALGSHVEYRNNIRADILKNIVLFILGGEL